MTAKIYKYFNTAQMKCVRDSLTKTILEVLSNTN